MQGSVASEKSVGLSLGLEPVNQVLVSREPSAGLAVHLDCPSPPLLHLAGWSHGTADQLGLQPGQRCFPLCAKIFLPAPRQQGLCPHRLTWIQLQVMWLWRAPGGPAAPCATDSCGSLGLSVVPGEQQKKTWRAFLMLQDRKWDLHCEQTTAEGGGQWSSTDCIRVPESCFHHVCCLMGWNWDN